MSIDLTKESAYADKTPYELWQQSEAIPVYKGLGIEDLRTVSLGPWNRKGAMGAAGANLPRQTPKEALLLGAARGTGDAPDAASGRNRGGSFLVVAEGYAAS